LPNIFLKQFQLYWRNRFARAATAIFRGDADAPAVHLLSFVPEFDCPNLESFGCLVRSVYVHMHCTFCAFFC
jgi:hypothetical protein